MIRNRVPQLHPGRTGFVLASGPSNLEVDLERLRPYPTIVVNRMVEAAPWADVLYFSDPRVFRWYRELVLAFSGLKVCGKTTRHLEHPAVVNLRWTGVRGLDLNPRNYRGGNGSGYAAINVAVHLGWARVVLLGFDMTRGRDGRQHCHDPHPVMPPDDRRYAVMLKPFLTLVEPLSELGVEVLNATPRTALECFPRVPFEAVLDDLERGGEGLSGPSRVDGDAS